MCSVTFWCAQLPFDFIVVKYISIKFAILTVLNGTVQWHLAHSWLCAAVITIYFRNIFITPPRSLAPSEVIPTPLPQTLATTTQISVSTGFPILHISCKWNQTLRALRVWLPSLRVRLPRSSTRWHISEQLSYVLYSLLWISIPAHTFTLVLDLWRLWLI